MKNNFILPLFVYMNPYEQKDSIYKDNFNKGGIYRWINKESGKFYIGSSMVLNRRIRDYLNERFLLIQIKKTNSYIYNSLLKYGYSNFILEILEHSDPNDILKREQYYLNQMNPEYNILKIAGSLKGFKHSLETKRNLSIINRGKTISELHKKKLHFNIKAHFIEIKDIKTNKIILFFSIRKAALYLKVHHSYIAKNLTKKGFCLTKGYYIYRSL